jgi:hypothetical protein
MEVANTITYYDATTITAIKKFMVSDPILKKIMAVIVAVL